MNARDSAILAAHARRQVHGDPARLQSAPSLDKAREADSQVKEKETQQLFIVFDVESIGLHGEGFAVAFVVVDRTGRMLEQGNYYCDPASAAGDDAGRAWVAKNVMITPVGKCNQLREVRGEFWSAWLRLKARGATLWADCAWPVEARFLAACVDDDPADRAWQGPYPLHDIATLRLAAGFDPLATVDRLPSELPAHDPLADARQSARLLIEALDILQPQD